MLLGSLGLHAHREQGTKVSRVRTSLCFGVASLIRVRKHVNYICVRSKLRMQHVLR